VARGLGLISLLVALGVAGFIMNAQLQGSPSQGSAQQEIDRAKQTVAAVAFQQAGVALEQTHALSGTYAGTSLDGFGVRLVRADAASYCVESGSGPNVMHLAGPGGAPSPGAC
jgi:hypothetical protein